MLVGDIFILGLWGHYHFGATPLKNGAPPTSLNAGHPSPRLRLGSGRRGELRLVFASKIVDNTILLMNEKPWLF